MDIDKYKNMKINMKNMKINMKKRIKVCKMKK